MNTVRNILTVCAATGFAYLLTQHQWIAAVPFLVLCWFGLSAIHKDRMEERRRQRESVWWRRDFEAVCRGEVFTDPVVTEDFIGEFSGKWEPR